MDHAGPVNWEALGEADGVRVDEQGRLLDKQSSLPRPHDRTAEMEEEEDPGPATGGLRGEAEAQVKETGEEPKKTGKAEDSDQDLKAAKNDDAETPVWLRGEAEAQVKETGEERKKTGKAEDSDRDLKAAKNDDAETPVWLWNDAIRDGLSEEPTLRGHTVEEVDSALDQLRSFLLCCCSRRGVTLSYFNHLQNEYDKLTGPSRSEERHYSFATAGPEERDGTTSVPVNFYRWREKFGRPIYKGWWNQFWDVAEAD
jgi:hypothetical protein